MEVTLPAKKILPLSLVVFLLSCAMGIFLAAFKPLWTDELYTLRTSVMESSYTDILLMRSESLVKEGNNCPLFYLSQKFFCGLAGYRMPKSLMEKWKKVGHTPGFYEDTLSQIVVRLQPVFFMSLAVAAIFYFFARFYSWKSAFYSLGISASSYMIQIYIAEARPYALWIFLTTLQLLLFIRICQVKEDVSRLWRALIVVHFCLAFTIVFSMAQIFIVSCLLWLLKEKQWSRYVFLTALPCLIAYLYSTKLPHYNYWFWHGPKELISANYPTDRLIIVLIYAVLLGFCFSRRFSVERFSCSNLQGGYPFLLYALGMLALAVAVLILFKHQAVSKPTGDETTPCFPVPARYFLFLVPVCVAATTLFSVLIVRALKNCRALQLVCVLGLMILLCFRFTRSLHNSKIYYPRLFNLPATIDRLEKERLQ